MRAKLAVGIGDVVAAPLLGTGKVFRIVEILPDGRVSGPAVLVRRLSASGIEVSEIPEGVSTLYFHGFSVESLEPVCMAPLRAKA